MPILLSLLFAAIWCTVTLAQGPSKQQELDAAGIASWTPGQGKGDGAAFSTLAEPIAPQHGSQGETGVISRTKYDSGSVTALPTVFGLIYGNHFDIDNSGNPLKATITLHSLSFLFAEDSLADTSLFIFVASAGATPGLIHSRASINIAGLANAGSSFTNLAAFNVIPQPALGTTGMFSGSLYLGAWCLNANTTVPVDNEAIGLDAGTFAGGFQGFTATSGGATSSVAFGMQNFNAVLRATIPGVPVELMSFDIE
jgi:hypothetical protein